MVSYRFIPFGWAFFSAGWVGASHWQAFTCGDATPAPTQPMMPGMGGGDRGGRGGGGGYSGGGGFGGGGPR